jgi:hypothetical protein
MLWSIGAMLRSMSREAAGHEVDCSNIPALIECRFVRRFSDDDMLHGTRYGVRTIADMLGHISQTVSETINHSDVFAHRFTNPHAACLIKEAQLLTCIPKRTDCLIEQLQYLDLSPVHSPALAVFAVELFRRFRLKVCMFMPIEANQRYEEMCFSFSTIVFDVGGHRHCELFA